MNINIYFIFMFLSLIFSFVGLIFEILEIKGSEIIIKLSIGILLLSIPIFCINEGIMFTKTISHWKEEQKLKINEANYIYNNNSYAINCFKEDGGLFCTGLDAKDITQVETFYKIDKE